MSSNSPKSPTDSTTKPELQSIFRAVPKWQDLRFYQKSEVLYQMTYVFCERFLPKHGDRTVDQMVQAARSGKQNIVEGSEDGKTSTAMEVNLLNVARSSIGELRQDYDDFLKARHLKIWTPADERFQPMQDFTKAHNTLSDYEPYFQEWTAEEMANVGLTLCYQVDVMMNKYLKGVEEIFIKEGGVKERMHKARTNYRRQQDERLAERERLKPELERQLAATKAEVDKWRAAYEDLKQRAVKAYNAQQKEIQRLRQELQGEGH
jgi:four helix bundle suffix protein